ncbi:hypothetical protein ABEY69_17620 [Priestia filamentosa]|uniref:hypothetical protein n=1 Tax=Priestia filamentosa TaxID=1402861 RepID=UPI003D2D791F
MKHVEWKAYVEKNLENVVSEVYIHSLETFIQIIAKDCGCTYSVAIDYKDLQRSDNEKVSNLLLEKLQRVGFEHKERVLASY